MPKLARVKAAARDVVQRTSSDLMGGCAPIMHLEDAVIVLEKVAGDRAGKGILHIRIDVHLHCAAGNRYERRPQKPDQAGELRAYKPTRSWSDVPHIRPARVANSDRQ